MKRKLKQGKIQVTFEFDFIGSDEAFDKIKDSQIIEDNIGWFFRRYYAKLLVIN
jgi:hypothetical protein